MSVFSRAAQEGAPMPQTLSDAYLEIVRLRQALVEANDKWANAAISGMAANRSLREEVKHLRKLLGME